MADDWVRPECLPLRPVDLPALRDETAVSVATFGPEVFKSIGGEADYAGQYLHSLTGSVRIGISDIPGVAGQEARRLAEAELFFASPEMSTLAHSAARSMPEFSITPEDAPSKNGLIYFAAPLNLGDTSEDGRPYAPIVAAAWSEVFPVPAARAVMGEQWSHGGLWVSWYLDRDGMLAQAMDSAGNRPPAAFTEAFDRAPRLMCVGMCPVPYGATPELDRVVAHGWEASAVQRLRVLKTAWLLMSQPIASVSDAVFNRATRRRWQREDKEPPRVRVITLRRPSSADGGDGERSHHHQWIVRGHWRQHWYPARKVHRPIWIAPHVKGPEGAPMLGGEKVYAWTR